MDPRLATLIDLQKARGAQYELEQQRNDLPNQRKSIQAELDGIQAEADRAREQHQQAELLQRRKEKLLVEVQEARTKRQQQLLLIKHNKEYKAATTEIDGLNKRERRLEEEIVAAIEEAEAAAEVVKEKDAKVEERKSDLEERIRVIEEQEAGLESEVEQARTGADAVAEQVAKPLLARFTRIFGARQGIAMVPANNGHCGACNVQLTPHTMQLVKRGQDLVICEGCGRYLYWDQEEEDIPVF